MADYQDGDVWRLRSYLPGVETVRGWCIVGQAGTVSNFKNIQARSIKKSA
jgi:hypothetical protein